MTFRSAKLCLLPVVPWMGVFCKPLGLYTPKYNGMDIMGPFALFCLCLDPVSRQT